jgi:hypothetical protein
VLPPVAMVLVTVAWFTQRGFIQLRRRPSAGSAPPKPPVSETGE